MVLGLLFIGAIPTTIGTCEAVSAQKRQLNEAKRSAKFNLVAVCNSKASRRRRAQVDGKYVVLRNGKVEYTILQVGDQNIRVLRIDSSFLTIRFRIHRYLAVTLSAATTSNTLQKKSSKALYRPFLMIHQCSTGSLSIARPWN
jgi:hypothetical protein